MEQTNKPEMVWEERPSTLVKCAILQDLKWDTEPKGIDY